MGCGGVAQLGERLLCKQGVVGSIPIASMALAWRVPGVCCCACRHGDGFRVRAVCAVWPPWGGAWRVGFGKRAPG